MKKKCVFILFTFLFLVCPNLKVNAMKPYEISSRVECPNIELANAKEDGSFDKIECYDDYNAALSAMYNFYSDGAILIKDGVIINAKYGLVDYDADFTFASTKYVTVYSDSSSSSTVGYVRTAGNVADDAALIDYDVNTRRAKIRVGGLTGWINKNDNSAVLYDIVPVVWVKTPQTYQVTNESMIHNFPGNVYGEKGSYSMSIDIKPDMLSQGTYYSYDGHYFYTDLRTLINDYRNNNYDNAVNRNNPYFNYYQYLSFRTKSNYNADNINQYLRRSISDDSSKMLNTGETFTWVQENYGVNAVLMMSIGMNESGRGLSTFAKERNNLFGLNAVDANPGEASVYPTVADCITDYGYRWLSYWYLQPGDSHYRGANLGNKYEGLNLKYASDPYWGETAAHYYYDIDRYFGFQDRDKNIAVLNSDYNGTIYAKKAPNGENIRIYDKNDFYQYKWYGTGISVISEITDEAGNVWFKIQSEPVLDGNLNYIGDSKSNPRINYDWNSYVYVEAKYFFKVNASTIPSEQIPSDPTVRQVSNVVNDASYRYQAGLISGISVGTTTDAVTNTLGSKGGLNISITDKDGNPKGGTLATGDKITVSSEGGTETLEVVISGDLTGDGQINSADLLRVRQHLLGQSLTGAYEKAAYMGYSTINSANLLKIRQYLLGQININ